MYKVDVFQCGTEFGCLRVGSKLSGRTVELYPSIIRGETAAKVASAVIKSEGERKGMSLLVFVGLASRVETAPDLFLVGSIVEEAPSLPSVDAKPAAKSTK